MNGWMNKVPKEQDSLLFSLSFDGVPSSLLGLDPLLPHPQSWPPISVSAFSALRLLFWAVPFGCPTSQAPAPKAGLGGKTPPPSFQASAEAKVYGAHNRQESHPKNYRNIAILPAEERQKLVLSFF